ncbi:MAG: hypothetical protein RBS39_00670 [Phycisphaerales bacterium]|jgi:hypothetical protein|nr:hypothetical protein [Phycisphaerales bacterium]
MAFMLLGVAPRAHDSHDARHGDAPSNDAAPDDAWLACIPASAHAAVHARGLARERTPDLERAFMGALGEIPDAAALRDAWLELARALELDPHEAFDRVLGDEATLYVRDSGQWALLTRIDRAIESRIRERLRPALRDRVQGYPVLAVGAGRVELVPMPDESGVVMLIAPSGARSLSREVLEDRRTERAPVNPPRLHGAANAQGAPLASVFVRGTGTPMIAEVRTLQDGLELRAAIEAPRMDAARRPLDAQALLVLSSLERDASCAMAIATRGDVVARLGLCPGPDTLRVIDGRAVERLMSGWAAWSGPLLVACVDPPREGGEPAHAPRGIAFACWVDTLEPEWLNAYSEWIASSAEIAFWPRVAGDRPRVGACEVAGMNVATITDRGVWGARDPNDPRSRGRRSTAWGLEPAPTGREAWWFGSIESPVIEQDGAPPVAAWARERMARALAWTTPTVAADSGVLMRGFAEPARLARDFAGPGASLGLLRPFERVSWEVTASGEGVVRIEARGEFSPAR